jgi:tetratricopeptide (TPR) repeat protein
MYAQLRNLTLPLLLVLLVVAVYARSVGNSFIYDDLELIVKQEPARNWAAWRTILTEPHWHSLPYYRPISRATMVIQKNIHGDSPVAFHVFNFLVMAACGLVAWRLLRGKPFEFTPLSAFFAAALFTLHPIASSCVYPICSGRETMIPGLLVLIALTAWLQPGIKGAVIGGTAAICALFSKEQAVVLPLILFAADRLLRTADRRSWKAYLPFLVFWPLYFWIRHVALHDSHQDRVVVILSFAPLGPLRFLLYGIQTWFFPFARLAYEPEWPVWVSLPRILGALGILVGLIGIGTRLGHPSRKILLFWVIWIILLVAPTSNILSQEAQFAERYWWLASLGFLAVVGQGASDRSFGEFPRRMGTAVLCLVLLIFALISFGRNRSFATRAQFLGDWLASNPRSSQANYSYADYLRDEGKTEEAKDFYRKAVALRDYNPNALNSMATLHMSLGELPEAIVAFGKVVNQKPDHYLAWRNLGECFARSGQPERAIQAFDSSLKLKPDHCKTLFNRGIMEKQAGRSDRAEEYFKQALAVCANFPNVHYALGIIASNRKDYPEALFRFRKVLELDYTNAHAHNGVGSILFKMGDTNAARQAFQQALRHDPDNAQAKQNLERHFQ